MNSNEAIKLRADMIDGQFELDTNTVAFMTWIRQACAALAQEARQRAPDTCDVGRLIAAVDHLQQTKNLFCDAVILGHEATERKKRKHAESSAERKD